MTDSALFSGSAAAPGCDVDLSFLPALTRQFQEARPFGGFRTMIIDPPWDFEHFSELGQSKGPQNHYNTLSMEQIKAIPIDTLLADDAAVFMWVTWPLAMRWHEVVTAWGLNFSGLAWEWVKYNEKTKKYAFGGGYGTRKNLEPCLLLTRGDPQLRQPITSDMLGDAVIPQGVRSIRDFIMAMPLDAVMSPRRQHSQKPDEQYDRVETMFDGPYVEVFSRMDRKNWTALGDQVGLLNAAS